MKTHYLILLIIAMTSTVSSAQSLQSHPMNLKEDGFDNKSFNNICKDSTGKIWVGTDSGLSIISDDKMTDITELKTEQGRHVLGKVYSILCAEHILIASANGLIDYDPACDTAFEIRINESSVQTDNILEYGDEVIFLDRNTNTLMKYNMTERKLRTLKMNRPETYMDFEKPQKIILFSFVSVSFIIPLLLLRKYQQKVLGEKYRAEKNMENSEKKISFLANIVHELRTPLIMIYNPIKEMLTKNEVSKEDYESIIGIYKQVNKMSSMINLILDGSRNKISRDDLIPESIELNSWINDILNDYDLLCSNDGHRIVFRPDPSIRSTEIDKNIIETGLSNLINNAVKYSPKGSEITISTQKKGEKVSITVRDEGRGFYCDAEELFCKNFRERPDDNMPGYGLGLTYVRSLMELAEGTITASHNDNGIGSSFCMTFPIRFQKNYK